MLERWLSLIAPHHCVVCGREGGLLCTGCQREAMVAKRSSCFLCNRLTTDWRACASCRRKTAVRGVIVAAHYEGAAKSLISRLKYERVQTAADILADLLLGRIPPGQFDVITPVPASSRRLRQRGYNQAHLIAKTLAKRVKLPLTNSLKRSGHASQVGTNRRQRLKQMEGQMQMKQTRRITGKRILVVDDVVTTGATLSEAGRALKAGGAKTVWGAAVAKH